MVPHILNIWRIQTKRFDVSLKRSTHRLIVKFREQTPRLSLSLQTFCGEADDKAGGRCAATDVDAGRGGVILRWNRRFPSHASTHMISFLILNGEIIVVVPHLLFLLSMNGCPCVSVRPFPVPYRTLVPSLFQPNDRYSVRQIFTDWPVQGQSVFFFFVTSLP